MARRVKCAAGDGERGTPWNMKRSAANNRRAHKPLRRHGGARLTRPDAPVPGFGPRAPMARGHGARAVGASRSRDRQSAELVFATVRPGFVAACMVDAAGGEACRAHASAGGDGCLLVRGRQARRTGRCRPPYASDRRAPVPGARSRELGPARGLPRAHRPERVGIPCKRKQTNGTFGPGCG